MTIQLITFDLDNTLWDVHRVIGNAESAMRNWLQSNMPDVVQAYNPDTLMTVRTELVSKRPELRHDLSALRIAVLERSMQTCGYDAARSSAGARAAFEVFHAARHEVTYFDGALDVLAALARDYQLGALSNGNADISRLGLDDYFAFSCSAASVGASKPAPDMFNAALKRSGVVAGNAVHIGDHLVDDIHGAASVGMHTIEVRVLPHGPIADAATPGTPSRVVTHLSQLPEVVAALV